MQQSYTQGSNYSGKGKRVGIVSARFNGRIVEALTDAAIQTLLENGVSKNDITSIHVPGAFELPTACQALADTNNYDGLISLACVIRGDTPHFDYVCQGSAFGIQQATLNKKIPIAFGVLTTDTVEQAEQRASTKNLSENKGHDAALCVLEMINVLNTIGK